MFADLMPYVPRLALDWQRDAPGAAWREIDGTLVFMDISGFTAMSERLARKGKVGAEEVTDILNTSFGRLLAGAYEEGGSLLKFGGDAMLLFFRGPEHEAHGCRAAMTMRRRLRDIGRFKTSAGFVSLRMSVGVSSGPTHFFLCGDSHLELMVVGPAVTRTGAMESAAAAGEILIAETTAAALPRSCVGQATRGGHLLRRMPSATQLAAPTMLVAATPNEARDFVPVALRRHLQSGKSESEHRRVTVAFIHFDGTDAIIERQGAARLAVDLDELVRVAQSAAAEFGVCFLASDIDRDGGKIILTAGAPSSSSNDEECMLRALRLIADAGTALRPRVGVHRGAVFAGDVGPSYRRTYTVMGDAVNLAARLMAKAVPGEIIATPDVIEQSATLFEPRPLEPFAVKGKAKPIIACAVGRSLGSRAARARPQAPLIGREREMRHLADALDAARAGHRRVVSLVGEPGIGKSRIVEETKARAAASFACVETGCEQYESSTAYFPFRRLLRPLLGLPAEADPEADAAPLIRRVSEVAPDLAPWLPLIAIPLDIRVASTREVDEMEPRFRKLRLHAALSDLMSRLMPGPSLIIVEDTHWIDEASAGLLRDVIASSSEQPWLLLLTARPGGVTVADDGVALDLPPLADDAALALAEAVSGDVALPQHEMRTLAARAGGNPLFLQEIVASRREHADLDVLPESVHSLLTSRIDRLAPEERRLLRYASVFGPRFDAASLAETFGDALLEVDALGSRELDEFVVSEEPGVYRFRHALIRETAYEGLPFSRRRLLHEQLGLAIERAHADQPESQAELLSLHFHRAQAHEKALRYSRVAGEHSKEKFANVEAAEFYRRAIEAGRHVPGVAPDEVRAMQESLGDVCEVAGMYEGAAAAYAAARRLAGADCVVMGRLTRKEGVIRERLGHYGAALRWYSRGLREIEPGSKCEKVELSLAYAGVRFRQGRYADCARRCREVLADAQAEGDRAVLGHAYYLLGHAYTFLGDPEGQRYRELALPIFVELGDHINEANTLNNLGVASYYEGRWDEALDFYRRSKEARERAGDVVGAATASNNIGEILSDQGRINEATGLFDQALRVWRAARYPVGVALALSNLGRAAVRARRFEAADTLLANALAGFREIGAASFIIETEARIAERHLFAGDCDAALEAIATALGRSEVVGQVAIEAMVYRIKGYALLGKRRHEESRAALENSLRLARSVSAEYEVALTLQALASLASATGQSPNAYLAEFTPIFNRLGVVAMPLLSGLAEAARRG